MKSSFSSEFSEEELFLCNKSQEMKKMKGSLPQQPAELPSRVTVPKLDGTELTSPLISSRHLKIPATRPLWSATETCGCSTWETPSLISLNWSSRTFLRFSIYQPATTSQLWLSRPPLSGAGTHGCCKRCPCEWNTGGDARQGRLPEL